MKNVFLDWINYQNRPFIQYAAPPRNSYLYLVSRLCTWHEAMLAQEKDEGRLDCQDGVAHSNAVARPLTKHHQPKLVGRVFWRKVFRIKDGGVLEVLLVPFGGVWSAILFSIYFIQWIIIFNVWGLSSREGPIWNSVGSGSASGQKSALETSKLQQSLNSEIFLYRRYTKYQIGLGTVYFCWQSIKASVTH